MALVALLGRAGGVLLLRARGRGKGGGKGGGKGTGGGLRRAARARALCCVMEVPRGGAYLGAVRTGRGWGKGKGIEGERAGEVARGVVDGAVEVGDGDESEKR